MNYTSRQTRRSVEKTDREQVGKEGGGRREEGRWKMEGSDKTLLTSKSLSNLIGVIESFQLLRHWADEVNTAMKSPPSSSHQQAKPTHNDAPNRISSYWTLHARWRQMSGLGNRTNSRSCSVWEKERSRRCRAVINGLLDATSSGFNHLSVIFPSNSQTIFIGTQNKLLFCSIRRSKSDKNIM